MEASTHSDETRVVSGQLRAVHAVGTIKHRRNKRKRRQSKFERKYTALGPLLKPEQKRIDYVLVQKIRTPDDTDTEDKKQSLERKRDLMERFEKAIATEGISMKEETIDGNIYKKLHCPFKRLCKEAETVKLEMPLKGCEKYPPERTTFITEFIEKYLETDDEVDYISAPFKMNKIDMFEGYDNPTFFFRPALRSFLTHHILKNIDIRDRSKQSEKLNNKMEKDAVDEENANILEYQFKVVEGCITDFCGCCPCYPKDSENPDNVILSKMGLPYMLMKEVYVDAFVLHEDSELSTIKETQDLDKNKEVMDPDSKESLPDDPRKKLDESWTKFYKFQPVWKIRNYFGEKIALYFAWAGMLITSLWIPTLFGMACFFYGLTVSAQRSSEYEEMPKNLTAQEEIKWRMGELYNTVSGSFDNDVTPFFALVICLWGTIFLEFWKRYNARLAYEWDVDQFEQNEPDRPEFFGTKVKKDPVTQKHDWFYSGKRQFLKFCISASSLIFMICLVFVSLAGVVVYRVIVSVDFCGSMSSVSCLVTSSVVSALLNAVSILILGRIYDVVALKLTEWENHRTQTQYNDALIIKLFAFSFANSYASCFYIAFFRGRFGGIFGLPPEYNDECEGDSCMSQLSFQVFILMLAKPFPKFLKDIVLPFIKKLWRNRPECCCKNGCCCCGNNKVGGEEKSRLDSESDTTSIKRSKAFLIKERYKPELGDFTLGEYTEKVIVYGFLMLFAASFPLSPLIALIILFVDKHIDAKRLLWLNRRPVAFIAQDLGMWYGILNFVNLIGVISNGFLIAFTSSWGLKYSMQTRLWICLGFEHIVFGLKFILAYLIPDVPKDVRLAIRREKYQVSKKFEDKGSKTDYYSDLVPAATYDDTVKSNSANYDSFPAMHFDDDDDDDLGIYGGGMKPLPTVSEIQEDKAMSPKGSVHGMTSLTAVQPEGSQLNVIEPANSKNASASQRTTLPPPLATPHYHPDGLDPLPSDDSDTESDTETDSDLELECSSDLPTGGKDNQEETVC